MSDSMSQTCFDYALGYISHYPKTTSALRSKLLEKDFDSLEIDDAIARLVEQGFLDDYVWGQLYITSLVRRGKSKYYISQKSYEKGLSKELFTQLRDDLYTDLVDDMESAIDKHIQTFLRKWYDQPKMYQKLYGLWFDRTLIKDAMDRFQEKQDSLLQ